MNEPSAEAARLRAREAAAAHEGDGENEKTTASIDAEAATQHEAQQDGAITERLPPRLASHLRILARTTGKPEAEFVAVVSQWHSGLVNGGVETDVALDHVSAEARRIPATWRAMDNLRDQMTRDLLARRAA